jgi:hypothetical protein
MNFGINCCDQSLIRANQNEVCQFVTATNSPSDENLPSLGKEVAKLGSVEGTVEPSGSLQT